MWNFSSKTQDKALSIQPSARREEKLTAESY
jgi:hypothetical protein